MTIDVALDCGLAALALVMGGWIIAARGSFAAAVGFVAYGLLLTLAWVRLDAIDVALMEGAIGSGLTGALLLRASSRLRASETPALAERPGVILRAVAALLSAIVAAMLATAVLYLPEPAPTLAPEAAANAGATGMGNPVTNVLMAFRAMDTMLEKVVLLVALVGVWSLAPRSPLGRPARPVLPGQSARPAHLPRPDAAARSASSSASICSGRAPIIRAAPSRAGQSSPPCGCWLYSRVLRMHRR